MKKLKISIQIILVSVACFTSLPVIGQLTNKEIRDSKGGRVLNDKSYVYWLPYPKKSRHLFVQGANSSFSHKGELSFDFKMKPGSIICAARAGRVIATKRDSDQGGLSSAFLNKGNHIIIKHDVSSIAKYWHLKKNGVLVKVGEVVQKGQPIGTSGNTGYSAFPHLHFQVVGPYGKELLPRFLTKKGPLYLRPGRWYKCVQD